MRLVRSKNASARAAFAGIVVCAAVVACTKDGSRETLSPNDDPVEYLPLEHLATLGVRAERIDAEHVLLCGPDGDWQKCACASATPCGDDPCPSYASASAEVPTPCGHRETGVCGPFRYVAGGDRVDYFDKQGSLVARRTLADYPAFCAGRASMEVAGKIPMCHGAATSRVVCGTGPSGTTELLPELLAHLSLSPAPN
jgi:hypothetical protein